MTSELTLVEANLICCEALEALKARVFTPEMIMTLVVRHPDDDDANMVVTADELPKIVDVLVRHIAEET